MRRYIKIGLIVLSTIIMSCKEDLGQLPYYNSPDFTPHFLNEVPNDFHKIKHFSLLAHTGNSFREKDMKGKITVVNFFFTTCPGICPRMGLNMKMVQETFINDNKIQLLSFSVTPEKDSVPVLAAYAKEKNVKVKKWLLLTGNKKDIYTLGRNYFFVDEDLGQRKDTSEFLHTENFILVDKQLHLRGIYNGLKVSSIQDLIRDIHVLENEN
jgi:protein SCO1